MRMKVSNYISEMLVKAGIHQAFMVTGGGAMHLDDALGHQEGLHCIYDHHEQACAIAAEAYARIHNEMAALWYFPDRCATIPQQGGPVQGSVLWAIRNLIFVRPLTV